MSEYELNELIILSGDVCGRVVEFWVSISIAVVIASFFTANRLNLTLIRILGFLYVLSSAFLGSLYFQSALRASHYFQQLDEAGYQTGHFSNPVIWITMIFGSGLFIGGVCGTVFFMFSLVRNSQNELEPT